MDLSALNTIIQKEQVLHNQLIKAKQDEQKHIATSNPVELLNNTEMIVELVEEIEKLEQCRRQLMQQFADEQGLEIPHPTLKDLLEIIPPANRADLEQSGEQLRQSVYELQQLNEANHVLLERSVELFNHEIKLLTQPKESGVYTKKGKQDSNSVARAGLNLRA